MGVSRAAVSKWETSSAYPDIFMLPKLAAYFGQSIDSLIGYEPQMEREEIRKWYRTLSEEIRLPSLQRGSGTLQRTHKKILFLLPSSVSNGGASRQSCCPCRKPGGGCSNSGGRNASFSPGQGENGRSPSGKRRLCRWKPGVSWFWATRNRRWS